MEHSTGKVVEKVKCAGKLELLLVQNLVPFEGDWSEVNWAGALQFGTSPCVSVNGLSHPLVVQVGRESLSAGYP